MLTESAVEAVRRILGRRAEELREAKARCGQALGLSACPACGVLVPSEEMPEHARSYADERHAVVEVMSS